MIKSIARWILRSDLEFMNERILQYAKDADRCESLRRRAESELKAVRQALTRTRQDLERTEKISLSFQTALSGNNEVVEDLYSLAFPHMPNAVRERWVSRLGLPVPVSATDGPEEHDTQPGDTNG